MRILVCSDSHGAVSHMCDLVEREKPDMVFHLGDLVRDGCRLSLAYPALRIEQVAGNCDYRVDAPLERTVTVEGCKLILCHGHEYYVKQGYRYLARHGQEEQADAILCGHTHRPYHATCGSLQVCNPGTVGAGRELTYGILTVENGAVAWKLKHV